MTQEEKSLLLQDLCARLPYHPIVSVAYNYLGKGIVWNFDVLRIKLLLEIEENESWEYIKPYLRPMSSMTEEEYEEYCYLNECTHLDDGTEVPCVAHINYLLKNHFDFIGLIPKGLALEAPNGMYN